MRNLVNILKSSAHKRGLAVPSIPEIPEDWSEEASNDSKALAAQFHPHMAEPARAVMNWNSRLYDRVRKPHWASVMAAHAVSLDLFLQMAPSISAVRGGSEWVPYMAYMTSDEFKEIVGVINEELVRVRDQQVAALDESSAGSGWNEDEAKGVVMEHLGNMAGIMSVGA